MKFHMVLMAAVLAAAAVVTTGCMEDRVRARAANELGCSAGDVTVTPLGSGGYVAEGCGQTMHLSCESHHGQAFCVTDGAPAPVADAPEPAGYEQGASAPRAPAAPPRVMAAGALSEATKEAAEVCADVQGPRGPGEASLTLRTDGSVAGVALEPPYQGTPVGDCLVSQLSRARVTPLPDKAVVLTQGFVIAAR